MTTTFSEKTLANLQWKKILDALAERSKTDLGRARSLARPFLDGAADVEEELARVEELRTLSVEEQLTLPLWGVRDIRPMLDRASKGGTLEPADLLACAAVLQALARVRDFVDDRQARMPRAWMAAQRIEDLTRVASRIEDLTRVASRIERSFEPGGELSDRASPELRELRERVRGLHRSIKAKVESLLHDEKFLPLLRENYFTIRNERYVLPVLASARSQVPGIVHNASQSGQTLFVEPQPLIGLGNELAIAQSMVVEEERRILKELSGALGAHGPQLEDSLAAAAALDAVEAAAKLGLDIDAAPAKAVAPDAQFRLLAMRHPLLALQQKRVVPNDVGFAPGHAVLVVSGPNAGGKTVTLSGVGLCALMLRAGLPIPAERGSTLPLFEHIDTAIGDAQDMSRDLSTFSAHLTTLRDIAGTAAPGSLVLVDEIAADTDPREGAAIALAVLEDLAGKGARLIVTTHLEELKAVAVTDTRYVNARVGFDAEHMAPTYRLHFGTPGSSSAIEIARRVGLPRHICDRAEENLKTSAGPLGRALTELERQRAELDAARRVLDEERARAEGLRGELQRARDAVRDREKAIEREARHELIADIDFVRGEIAALLAGLQSKPSPKAAVDAQAQLQRIAEREKVAQAHEEARASVGREERLPEGAALKPGMRVKVPNLGEAQIVEISGDEALVLAGALKVRRKVKDLVPLRGAAKTTPFPARNRAREERLKAAEQAGAGALNYGATRIDVRGMRAEDALKAVETFLDRCYGEGKPGAFIVHGLGTGALRASIRDYVRSSPYVRTARPGEDHEGGEGTTVVELSG